MAWRGLKPGQELQPLPLSPNPGWKRHPESCRHRGHRAGPSRRRKGLQAETVTLEPDLPLPPKMKFLLKEGIFFTIFYYYYENVQIHSNVGRILVKICVSTT